MSKSKKEYRSYIVAIAKPTEQLDSLNRLGGQIYSKTVSLVFKTHKQKGFWLSDSGLKAYLKFKKYPCHAHSVQAIIDDYCGARRSFFENKNLIQEQNPQRKLGSFTHSRGVLRVYPISKANYVSLWEKIRNPFGLKLIRSFIRKCLLKSHLSTIKQRNSMSSMQHTPQRQKN